MGKKKGKQDLPQANNHDNSDMVEEAIEKYMRAAESLLDLLKSNKNKKLQQIAEDKMEEYLARAAFLKKKHDLDHAQ